MTITASDASAVRAVLTGEVTLAQVASSYSPKQKACLVATVLTAAGQVSLPRTTYAAFVRRLTKTGYWTDSPEWQDERTMASARYYHLRETAGSYTRVTPLPPELAELAATHRDQCLRLYAQAKVAVDAKLELQAQNEADNRLRTALMSAVRSVPELVIISDAHARNYFDPLELRAFHAQLGDYLRELSETAFIAVTSGAHRKSTIAEDSIYAHCLACQLSPFGYAKIYLLLAPILDQYLPVPTPTE